ncbi:hypothetical protein FBU59_003884 [Linderina macrospora]|uniref:Uncharacterized protein n=1 Tax=Linderina macrospora TaxID=4868 RepID=A0ACC1J779_9FUNG|nr:hypothetical protein FBU59_003884 [Linderina macrospora]
MGVTSYMSCTWIVTGTNSPLRLTTKSTVLFTFASNADSKPTKSLMGVPFKLMMMSPVSNAPSAGPLRKMVSTTSMPSDFGFARRELSACFSGRPRRCTSSYVSKTNTAWTVPRGTCLPRRIYSSEYTIRSRGTKKLAPSPFILATLRAIAFPLMSSTGEPDAPPAEVVDA